MFLHGEGPSVPGLYNGGILRSGNRFSDLHPSNRIFVVLSIVNLNYAPEGLFSGQCIVGRVGPQRTRLHLDADEADRAVG